MMSASAVQRIVNELERLIAEARGCMRSSSSIEGQIIWKGYLERLERRRDELLEQLERRLQAHP